MTDFRECWELLGLPSQTPDLDNARSRLLGVLKGRDAPSRFIFPILRRSNMVPPWHQPLRTNIDYIAVGRKTFLVMPDDLEPLCGEKSDKP